MALSRWRPFSEMMSLRDMMDRLLEETYMPAGMEMERMLPVNMYQTDDNVIVDTPVSGIKPEDIDIRISGNTLTIRGERKEEKEVKEENYVRKEMQMGKFYREVTLPVSVQPDKATATFENGILHLTLPKAEEIKPKRIPVKAKGEVTGGTQQS